jgi:hypothetical protein
MKIKNIKFKNIVMVMLILGLIVNFTSIVYGATNPTLVTKLNTAMKKILSYLETLATPIAGVAIATGVLMRKLSFGDDEKMIKGKKVIVNAIVGYAIIISIDLIIKFVESLL